MSRYAVLIDYYTEGLHYVMRTDNPRGSKPVVHEVDSIVEALALAADHANGHNWEIVERIDRPWESSHASIEDAHDAVIEAAKAGRDDDWGPQARYDMARALATLSNLTNEAARG